MPSSSPDTRQKEILRVLQSKEETRTFYDRIAKCYDLLSEHTERPLRKAGLNLLAASAGETILEVGFGTGHCLVALARSVGSQGAVLGIDLSGRMLEESESLLDKEGLSNRVRLTCGDAAELPYEDESTDGIFVSFTLELFDTPEIPRVLAECRRVLRPGGRLVVVSITKDAKPGVVIKAFEWTHRHFPGFMDCRPIYAARSLEEAGFDIREVRHERMWIPVEIVLGVNPGA